MFSLIETAHAADVDSLILKVNQYIINPFIAFLFVLATLIFLEGVVRFYIAGDEKTREDGKRHIMWGIVGMFIMVSVFGIMNLIINTFGINLGEFGASVP